MYVEDVLLPGRDCARAHVAMKGEVHRHGVDGFGIIPRWLTALHDEEEREDRQEQPELAAEPKLRWADVARLAGSWGAGVLPPHLAPL